MPAEPSHTRSQGLIQAPGLGADEPADQLYEVIRKHCVPSLMRYSLPPEAGSITDPALPARFGKRPGSACNRQVLRARSPGAAVTPPGICPILPIPGKNQNVKFRLPYR